MSSPQPAKNLPFIFGAIIIAGLLAFGMYKYLTKDNKDNKKALSKGMNPSPYPSSSSSPSPLGPCSKYEDENGACSQDGLKSYNIGLAGQMNYICKASGKQNQIEECMEMCQNGQFGLPPCQSCCQSICYSMVCPPSGGGGPLPPPPRPDGKAGCGECITICRDDPTGIYGISCDQCNRSCA